MSPKWILFVVFLFILMQLAGMVIEGSTMSGDVRDALNTISSWGIIHETQTFGLLDYVKAPFNYFGALWTVLTYDSPVFDGSFEIVRWIFVAPILAAVGFGLVVLFFGAFQRTI